MQIISYQTSKEKQRLWGILTPSILSGVLGAIIAICVVGGVIGLTAYHASSLPPFIAGLSTDASGDKVTHSYQMIARFLDGETAFSNAPLALFWGMVGLVIYFLVVSSMGFIRTIMQLRQETHYVHIKRQNLVHETLIRFLLRVAMIIILWMVLVAFVRYLMPYVLASTHVAAVSPALRGVEYAVGALLALWLGLHALTVLARLVALRVRLFG
jgi:hypothetical protein